jgi:hypothetical protein
LGGGAYKGGYQGRDGRNLGGNFAQDQSSNDSFTNDGGGIGNSGGGGNGYNGGGNGNFDNCGGNSKSSVEGYSNGGNNSHGDRVSFDDNPRLAGPTYNSNQAQSQRSELQICCSTPTKRSSNHEQVVQDYQQHNQFYGYPHQGGGGYESGGGF